MSLASNLNGLRYYLESVHQQSVWARRSKNSNEFLSATIYADCAVALLIETKKSGYPLWGEVWPWDDSLRHGTLSAGVKLSQLWERFRLARRDADRFSYSWEGSTVMNGYPNLHWHLTSDTWQDGRKRQRSRLNVWVEGDRFKAFVRDMNTRFLMWADGVSFEDLLLQLDARLTGPQHLWRRDRYFHGDAKRITDHGA